VEKLVGAFKIVLFDVGLADEDGAATAEQNAVETLTLANAWLEKNK
jgi:hypothetical protein